METGDKGILEWRQSQEKSHGSINTEKSEVLPVPNVHSASL